VAVAQLAAKPILPWHFGCMVSSTDKIQDGAYIQNLPRETGCGFADHDCGEHLAQEVAGDGSHWDSQANMEHRRQHLERITQLDLSNFSPDTQQQPTSEWITNPVSSRSSKRHSPKKRKPTKSVALKLSYLPPQ